MALALKGLKQKGSKLMTAASMTNMTNSFFSTLRKFILVQLQGPNSTKLQKINPISEISSEHFPTF